MAEDHSLSDTLVTLVAIAFAMSLAECARRMRPAPDLPSSESAGGCETPRAPAANDLVITIGPLSVGVTGWPRGTQLF